MTSLTTAIFLHNNDNDVDMAVETAAHRQVNEESDYGSDLDLDNDTWDDLFSQSESQPPPGLPACINSEEIEEGAVLPDDDSEQLQTRTLRVARIRENLHKAIVGLGWTSGQLEQHERSGSEKVEIEYNEDNRGSFATAGKPTFFGKGGDALDLLKTDKLIQEACRCKI